MRPLLLAVLLSVPALAGTEDSFLLRGATVHPVSSGEIADCAVLVTDGRIAEIGPKLKPPKGVRVVEAKGLHVYPGMIDSATQIGLSEVASVEETIDVRELGAYNPQLRVISSMNPASEHIPVTRANGITAVVALPDGGVISGAAALVHLDGWTWEEMAIRPSVGMAMQFPVLQVRIGRGLPAASRVPYAEAKKRYDAQLRELSEFVLTARRYQKAKTANTPEFKPDVKLEAMLPVLEGKLPLVITAVRERAIRDAIQFAEKEKLRIILAEAREADKVAEDLKAKNIPVILGPTLALPMDEGDAYDEPFTLPAQLHKAGVKFAFGSFGNQFARNLPYQAANAVAFGLPYEEALKAVTLYPAEIWGVAAETGAIEKGKWADLIVTDGDPLETRTQVKQMFIQGKPVDLSNKHLKLYEKYKGRP